MQQFTEQRLSCPQCKGEFAVLVQIKTSPEGVICPRCLVQTPEWESANQLWAAAFYLLPDWRFERLRACVAASKSAAKPHRNTPERECLDCCLVSSYRRSDGTWAEIYSQTVFRLSQEFGVYPDNVRDRLRQLSGGQCIELGGN